MTLPFFCPRTHVKRVIICLIFAAGWVPAWANAPCGLCDITGPAHVVDGDSLMVDGRKLRLFGIDAPEWDQVCDRNGAKWMAGQDAKGWLAAWIAGKTIHCQPQDVDRYGRIVATCQIDGISINQALVAKGWAIAYRRYSDQYFATETEARTAKVGIWAGTCDEPEAWRHAHPRAKGGSQ